MDAGGGSENGRGPQAPARNRRRGVRRRSQGPRRPSARGAARKARQRSPGATSQSRLPTLRRAQRLRGANRGGRRPRAGKRGSTSQTGATGTRASSRRHAAPKADLGSHRGRGETQVRMSASSPGSSRPSHQTSRAGSSSGRPCRRADGQPHCAPALSGDPRSGRGPRHTQRLFLTARLPCRQRSRRPSGVHCPCIHPRSRRKTWRRHIPPTRRSSQASGQGGETSRVGAGRRRTIRPCTRHRPQQAP
mmetsp:Transcript_14957/g.35195  ORF Transcript_14957/g.35195 Transcript_14957/m.35195 type:complete len:248 (+) Transcript_14957:506-1249(+)